MMQNGTPEFWEKFSEARNALSPTCNFSELIDRVGLNPATNSLSGDYFQEDGVCVKSDVVLEWLKVEIAKVEFVAAEDLEIRNSIFLGDVRIILEKGVCSPKIHSSIFMGTLVVELAGPDTRDLEISNCLIGTLAIKNSSLREINISESVAKSLSFEKVSCQKFSAFSNIFDRIQVSKLCCPDVKFPAGQVRNFGKIFSRDSEERFSASAPPSAIYINHLLTESLGRNSENHSIAETFEFLLNNTSSTSDATTRAHLRYLQILSRMNSCVAKSVVWAFGGLLKPYRVAAVSVFTVFAFSLLYFFFFLDALFIGEKTLCDYWECLYFSGIAFTTIGFGDIVPKGGARAVAVVEGVTGVILSSALVASFIRKYTE